VSKVLSSHYLVSSHPASTGDILPIVVVGTNSNVAFQSTSGALISQTHIFQACHMLPLLKLRFSVGDHLQRQYRKSGSKSWEWSKCYNLLKNMHNCWHEYNEHCNSFQFYKIFIILHPINQHYGTGLSMSIWQSFSLTQNSLLLWIPKIYHHHHRLLGPLLSQFNPMHIFTTDFSKIYFHVIFSQLESF
jgi:hypothetical protein